MYICNCCKQIIPKKNTYYFYMDNIYCSFNCRKIIIDSFDCRKIIIDSIS